MSRPEDFNREFFIKNRIDIVEIGMDPYFCNARCEFCYLTRYYKTDSGDGGMPLHRDREAVDLMTAFVTNWANFVTGFGHTPPPIMFTGGEITIYPHTLAMLKEWAKACPRLSFFFITNGILFNDHWIDFAVATNSEVKFSVNAFSDESHNDRMAMGNVFSKVVENLKKLSTKMGKNRVRASFVMSPKTVREDYFRKIDQMLRTEFWDKGYTNIVAEYGTNVSWAGPTLEPSFYASEFARDDSLIETFIPQLPYMLEHRVMEDKEIYNFMSALQMTHEEIVVHLPQFMDLKGKVPLGLPYGSYGEVSQPPPVEAERKQKTEFVSVSLFSRDNVMDLMKDQVSTGQTATPAKMNAVLDDFFNPYVGGYNPNLRNLELERVGCARIHGIRLNYKTMGQMIVSVCCQNDQELGNLIVDPVEKVFGAVKQFKNVFMVKHLIHHHCLESCANTNAMRRRGWKKQGEGLTPSGQTTKV